MEHSQALDSSRPVIDIHPLIAGTQARDRVAKQIGQACREYGFFYIAGHGVNEESQRRLEGLSRQFFAGCKFINTPQPTSEKQPYLIDKIGGEGGIRTPGGLPHNGFQLRSRHYLLFYVRHLPA